MVKPEVICSIVDSYLESRKVDMRRQLYASVDTLLEDLMRGVGRQVQQLLIAFQPAESTITSTTSEHSHQLLQPMLPIFESTTPMADSVYALKSPALLVHNNNYDHNNLNQTSATVVAHNGGGPFSIVNQDSQNVNNKVPVNGSSLKPDKIDVKETGSSSKVKFFKNRHATTVKKEEEATASPTASRAESGRTVTVKVCYNDGSVKATKFTGGKRSRDTIKEEEEEGNASPLLMTRAKRCKSEATSKVTKSSAFSATPGSQNGRQKSNATTTTKTTSTKGSTASSVQTPQTPKRVFACPQKGCSKVLNRRGEFVTHMRRHLAIQPYYCTWTACTFRGYEKFASLRHVKQTHYRRSTKDGTPEQINQWDPNLYIKVDEALLNAELPSPKAEEEVKKGEKLPKKPSKKLVMTAGEEAKKKKS